MNAPREEKRGLGLFPTRWSYRAQKRALRLRLGVRNGISTSHYQRSSGIMGSSTSRLPANATPQYMSKLGMAVNNPSVSYEVIRIRRREGFEISGRFVTPAKVYPNPEVWGVDGFTLTDKDAAFAKVRQLASASGEAAP
jgi:hypothetical protein